MITSAQQDQSWSSNPDSIMNNSNNPKNGSYQCGQYVTDQSGYQLQAPFPNHSYGCSAGPLSQEQQAHVSAVEQQLLPHNVAYHRSGPQISTTNTLNHRQKSAVNQPSYLHYPPHQPAAGAQQYSDHMGSGVPHPLGYPPSAHYSSVAAQDKGNVVLYHDGPQNTNNNHMLAQGNDHVIQPSQYNAPKAGDLQSVPAMHPSSNVPYVYTSTDPWQREPKHVLEYSQPCPRPYKDASTNLPGNNCGGDGKRIFACPKCSKVFKRGDHLKRHLLSVHDREHPYQCGECSKGFASINNLARHEQASHSGMSAKGHLCVRCGVRYGNLAQIEEHATALHKVEDAAYMKSINQSSKTFSCDLCQKTVSSEKNLTRHIKKVHGEEALTQLSSGIKSQSLAFGENTAALPKHSPSSGIASGPPQSLMEPSPAGVSLQHQQHAVYQQPSKASVYEHNPGTEHTGQHPRQGFQPETNRNADPKLDSRPVQSKLQLSICNGQQQVSLHASNQMHLPSVSNGTSNELPLTTTATQNFVPGSTVCGVSENVVSTPSDTNSVSEAFSMAMKTLSEFSYEDFSFASAEYVPSSLSVFQSNSPLPSFHYPSAVQVNQTNTVASISVSSHSTLPPSAHVVAPPVPPSNVNSTPTKMQISTTVQTVVQRIHQPQAGDASTNQTFPTLPQYPLPDGSVHNAAALTRRGRPKKIKKSGSENENDLSTTQAMISKPESGTSKFTCTVCQETYEGIDNLMQHIEVVHLSANPHECCICQKRFAQAGNVKRHIRFVHLRERPFQCRDCDSTFDRLCYLQRHMRSHIDSSVENPRMSHLNPCNCPECGKRCLTAHHLRGHMQRKHFAKNKKPSEKLMEKYGHLFSGPAIVGVKELDEYGHPIAPNVKVKTTKTEVNNLMPEHEPFSKMPDCLQTNTSDPPYGYATSSDLHGRNSNRNINHTQTPAVVYPETLAPDARNSSESYSSSCGSEPIKSQLEKLLENSNTDELATSRTDNDMQVSSTFAANLRVEPTSVTERPAKRSYKFYNNRCCFRKEKGKLLQYKCQHCPCRNFSNLALLKSHIAVVHHCTTRRHLCVLCGRSYAANILLMAHVSKRHCSKPMGAYKKRRILTNSARQQFAQMKANGGCMLQSKVVSDAKPLEAHNTLTDVFNRDGCQDNLYDAVSRLLPQSLVDTK